MKSLATRTPKLISTARLRDVCDDQECLPVRECFGPRLYDWQLEQTPEESWRECHLHARNLLGPTGYQTLLDELEGKTHHQPRPRMHLLNQNLRKANFLKLMTNLFLMKINKAGPRDQN